MALSRTALKELSHSSLFFHGILSFFGDDQASKRSRTDDAGETVAANCIVVVGDQAATKPRSLVNMLLLSLRALLSHPTANAESLHALLRCVVEVAWRQCRSHLPQPAAFSMERKRDKESRNAVSVPHFHILLLDLLQSVCCQLSRRFSRLTPSARPRGDARGGAAGAGDGAGDERERLRVLADQ